MIAIRKLSLHVYLCQNYVLRSILYMYHLQLLPAVICLYYSQQTTVNVYSNPVTIKTFIISTGTRQVLILCC